MARGIPKLHMKEARSESVRYLVRYRLLQIRYSVDGTSLPHMVGGAGRPIPSSKHLFLASEPATGHLTYTNLE